MMSAPLSDHQDTDSFTYSRTWKDIEVMLDKAERLKNIHSLKMQDSTFTRKERVFHVRNFKALEGVVKTLRWTLGDKNINHPLK